MNQSWNGPIQVEPPNHCLVTRYVQQMKSIGIRMSFVLVVCTLGFDGKPLQYINAQVPKPLADANSDLSEIAFDLVTPRMTHTAPSAGNRVRHQLPRYSNSEVYHSLYLPENWQPAAKYPVIVEYAGNGPFKNSIGDQCSGKVEDCNLGYGISGGRDFIWVCLPYVNSIQQQNQLQWWGDLDETVRYCKEAVQMLIDDYGGDRNRVFLSGFSRGAIACNYIGLHDDEIAAIWRGFICHSHYDGVRKWNYPNSGRASAVERLNRLQGRPQFITQEKSVEVTRRYLKEVCPEGDFEIHVLPFRNHSDQWVLRNLPLRARLREWIKTQLEKTN